MNNAVFKYSLRAVVGIALLLAGHVFLERTHESLAQNWSLGTILGLQAVAVFLLVALFFLVIRSFPRTVGGVSGMLLWTLLIVVAHHLAFVQAMEGRELLTELGLTMGVDSLIFLALAYALLIAFPFVPGLELGIVIMLLFGWPGCLAVYLATNAGLVLAFVMGRRLPGLREKLSLPVLTDRPRVQTRLTQAVAWAERVGLVRYRYLLLIFLLNLPGNSVLGGGGGIALLSGFSGRYRLGWFAAACLTATFPVPLLIALGWLSV